MSKPALRVVASSRPKLVRDPLADLARSFERHLRAKNRSEHTIASYMEAVRQFGDFLKSSHRPQDPALVERADVELFTQHLLPKFKPSTAANRFRSLQQFFRAERAQGRVTVYGDEHTMERLIQQEKEDRPAPRCHAVVVPKVEMAGELPLPGTTLSQEDLANARLVVQAKEPLRPSGESAFGLPLPA